MDDDPPAPSRRRDELLEAAYRYALEHGLADLSLRPLSAAIGSSPRVLLYLFGSKDGLVRALLARARTDEVALLDGVRDADADGLAAAGERVWSWLSDEEHRPLVTLWVEGYARSLVVRAVRGVADLRFVNGGGTGSLHTTSRERAVTEVAAGSGLYHPRLFDHYRAFTGRPAALFALPVVRRPGARAATALGGGYPASGTATPDRLPQPYLPAGLTYSATEGAGEVQTPLLGAAADGLAIGDRVWLRHAKAGELCERFAHLHLVEGDQVTATVPTYRGEGRDFL